jgi:DNA ligase D-like protein (predicted ligase)
MIPLLRRLSKKEEGALKPEEKPDAPAPMLAVLVNEAFSDPDWIFERKLDGERALCVSANGQVRLRSRNDKDLTSSYPELVEALENLEASPDAMAPTGSEKVGPAAPSWIGDGEVVAFDDDVTSFSRLQQRMQISDPERARDNPVTVYYYLFDLLYLDGHDLTDLPLRTRKSLLRDAFEFSGPLRFTPHHNEEGEALLREACKRGWEGIMAKRADSPYRGTRSRDWLKFKCVNRQELIIGGFTDPGGTRQGFGALLVGYYRGGELRYAGKVGTGFDDDTLRRLSRLLKRGMRKTPPFSKEDADDLPSKGVHWVTPKLVGEFGFSEWTSAGRLRHPRFLGLRRDKDPEDVEREEPT